MAKTKTKNKKRKTRKPKVKALYTIRLEENYRVCDACGDRIGRWTKKCSYDAVANEVYCSAGGCSDTYKLAPKCSACGEKANPFVEGVTTIPTWPASTDYCSACASKLQTDGEWLLDALEEKAEELDAKSKRARKNHIFVLGFEALREIPSSVKLTPEQTEAVKKGPYVVVLRNRSLYNVLRPLYKGQAFVRASGLPLQQSFEKCAEFNGGPKSQMKAEILREEVLPPEPDVKAHVEGCWLYLDVSNLDSEVNEKIPKHWTRDGLGRIKTREGTAKAETIQKWFEDKDVTIR